jgi:cbb3-type cytochrome c oxidase subunit III
MNRNLRWIGFLATLLIVVTLAVTALREPQRQVVAAASQLALSIAEGTDLYAENCVVCHGAAGEGLGSYPALAEVANMDEMTLYNTIERGRYNTTMAAYGVAEGGVLQAAQVDALVNMIRFGDWPIVETRVAELGLTPPEIVVAEVSEETLTLVRDLPDGAALADAVQWYSDNCAACHGANGEGTTLAPALNSDELRTRMADADLTRTIEQGVPGTLMAAWDAALSDAEVAGLVTLVRRWDELDSAGVAFMPVAAAPLDMSPEVIAVGEQLYHIACSSCHGAQGYGTALAPALNNQVFLAETPDAAIQQIIAQGVTGTKMPAWGGRLAEADINALVAYLRSLETNAPPIIQTG